MIPALFAMAAATWVAAAIDVRTSRIPNAVCAAVALVAILAHAAAGPLALGATLALMLAVAVVTLPLYAVGAFGGGDLKLFAACAGVVGPHDLFTFALEVLVAGSAFGLLEALRRRRLRALLASTLRVGLGGAPSESFRVPYAVAIAIGALWFTLSSLVTSSPRLL